MGSAACRAETFIMQVSSFPLTKGEWEECNVCMRATGGWDFREMKRFDMADTAANGRWVYLRGQSGRKSRESSYSATSNALRVPPALKRHTTQTFN